MDGRLGILKVLKPSATEARGFGGTAFLLIMPEKNCAAVVLCNEESNAHFQAVRAVADVVLEQKPQAETGFMDGADQPGVGRGRYEYCLLLGTPEIKSREDEFYFDEDDLLDLSLQLFTANNLDLAIDVLSLNIQIFPNTYSVLS